MTNRYPYVASGGPLSQAVEQFRKAVPSTINAETLRKLGLAPKNESYVINVLKFLGLVDDKEKPTSAGMKLFTTHEVEKFREQLTIIIKNAYKELFELHGETCWNLDHNKLTAYFRGANQSTEIVGKRQATTFQTLAAIAGRASINSKQRPTASAKVARPAKVRRQREARVQEKAAGGSSTPQSLTETLGGVGLTVRIEINLPAQGDQETYDRIFRSIRENLLNVT